MLIDIITAEEIVESYKISGIKPINKKTVSADKNGKFCGCALTSLYVAYHGVLPDLNPANSDSEQVLDWADKEINHQVAIAMGFDYPEYFVVNPVHNYHKQRNEAAKAANILGLK